MPKLLSRSYSSGLLWAVLALAGGLSVAGCRLEMYDGSRVKPFEQSTVFFDSMTARQPLAGTVPVDGRKVGAPDATLWDTTGSLVAPIDSGTDVTGTLPSDSGSLRAVAGAAPTAARIRSASIPFRVTMPVLERGRERYNIFCAPCHGATGEGNGMIVQRGFPKPPSFHLERLRTAADGHFYDVITNGFGMMYRYDYRVKPLDRWAITAYVRALQLSRDARPGNMPVPDTAAVR